MAFSQVIALINIATQPLLVSPVSSQTMLSNEVHFGGSDLNLDGDAIIPNHHSMQGAVAIGFGVLNVVLEATVDRPPQIVHLHNKLFFISQMFLLL